MQGEAESSDCSLRPEVLRPQLLQTIDASALRAVASGALDRQRVESMVGQLFNEDPAKLAGWSREELVVRLVSGVWSRDDVLVRVVSELDRATQAERTLISSIDLGELEERIGSLKAPRHLRHGARIVWALVRDSRPEVGHLATRAASEYLAQMTRLARASAAIRDKGAAVEAEAIEEGVRELAENALRLEEEFSTVEKERRRLQVEIDQRERQLQQEADLRRELSAELSRLQERVRPQVSPPPSRDGRSTPGSGKARRFEKRLGALEKERDLLAGQAQRVPELEAENLRLRQKLASMREERASYHRQTSRLTAGPTPEGEPLVQPPRTDRGRVGPLRTEARVGIFLDVANLSGAARRLHDRAVDYCGLLPILLSGRRLVEARAFAIDKGTANYEAFAFALRQAGYRVETKKPKVFPDGTVKADWDVGIAVQILLLRDKLDVAVLGSGDGDFLPLVTALKGCGVRVELAAFVDRAAPELLRAADHVVTLDPSVLQP